MSKTTILRYLHQLLKVSKIQPTTNHEQVPLVFREPFIYSGFRLTDKPWIYYILSLFQIHNETLNVWSHLLAAVIFLMKTFNTGAILDFSEPHTWPILAFGFACVTYALCSTGAHLFHSKSPKIHYTCFQIDYLGIGIYGHGTGILLYYYTGTDTFYRSTLGAVFLPLLTFLGLSVCIVASYAKMHYERPYPMQRKILQLGTIGSQVLLASMPFHDRLCHCVNTAECSLLELTPHFKYLILFFVSSLFFASHLPERWFPGSFDIVGHGHQIFHFIIIFMSLFQFDAGLYDMQQKIKNNNQIYPSFTFIFGSLALIILIDSVALLFLRRKLTVTIRRDASKCPLTKID